MVLTNSEGVKTNVMAWTSPIKTATGKLIQVLAIFADVTQLRKLQANLANLGLMVSTLSHDLKGSLTGLDAGLYMIDSGFYRDTPGRIEEGLDTARLMVERIRRLVSDILYYAKERDIEPVKRMDLLQFAGGWRPTWPPKCGAPISSSTRSILNHRWRWTIDADLMRTALYNMIDNAVEACIDSSAPIEHRIDFFVQVRQRSGQFCRAGHRGRNEPQKTDSIFDLFYSTKGKQRNRHRAFRDPQDRPESRGPIFVHSEPGRGSRFEIVLPRKPVRL
jgi:signal transduction histidine kinase